MSDTKKRVATLTDELQATIRRIEAQHVAIYERDKPTGASRFVGRRWSEVTIQGDDQRAARQAARGLFAACSREIGGCGGRGFQGDSGARSVCGVCEGAGRIFTAAGVEFLRAIASALSPEPKPEATPAALEEHNIRVAEAERQREENAARRAEQQRQERENPAAAAQLEAARARQESDVLIAMARQQQSNPKQES